LANPNDVFSFFQDASSIAKETSMKFGRPFTVRRIGNSWAVYDASHISSSREMANQQLETKSDSFWSDGRPIESTASTSLKWKSPSSDSYKENGQPGDYRPDGATVCFICSGRGTGHGGRSCSRCHGYGYIHS